MSQFRLARNSALLLMVMCLLVLLGWQIEAPLLRSVLPGAPPTTPLTAVILLSLAAALWCARRALLADANTGWRWICWVVCAAVLGLCLWILIQYAAGLGPSLEVLLFSDEVLSFGGRYPGRPSPHTALTGLSLALGTSLTLLPASRAQRAAQTLILLGGLLPWMALFGYVSLSSPFYALPDSPSTGMSPITASAYLVLVAGLLGLRPEHGLMALFRARSTGGQIVRLLLPTTIVGPMFMGWLSIYGRESGVFDSATGFAFTWGLSSLLLAGIAVGVGFLFHHRDLERQQRAEEREAAEAAMRAREERFMIELERRAAALELSNLELERFAYVVSHDLQTPLRSISGFLQLLQSRYQGQLDDKADDWIERAVDSTQHLKTLISNLLAYSRVDSEARPFEQIDLNAVLEQVVTLLNASIQQSGARLTHDPLPTVMGDRSQLTQLLQNLVGNALKYHGPEAPEIHVLAQRRDQVWLLGVRDNGIGIDPAQFKHIFEVFGRLHTAQEYPGVGIGLSVCRRVVFRHKGKIWVESKPGEGSTFYFTIPILVDETRASDEYRAG
jgi:signal transduction histidine kinase